MKSSMKKVVTTGALVTALALGGAGVAFATTGAVSAPPSDTTAPQDQEQTFVGTVTAPAEINDGEASDDATEAPGTETNDDSAEAAESTALEALATITPAEAAAAAVSATPGTAGTVQLENENGFVVYGVEVTASNGSVTDVKIDAGNGSVLVQEADGVEGQDEN